MPLICFIAPGYLDHRFERIKFKQKALKTEIFLKIGKIVARKFLQDYNLTKFKFFNNF